MIVTILYRIAGSLAAGKSGFTDVAERQYYAKAVAWASAHGLINGMITITMVPGGTTTRAQAAVILKGFCENVLYLI